MTNSSAGGQAGSLVSPILLGLVLLAALVRILYWVGARDLSLFQQPTGDAATYVFLAAEIGRDGLGAPLGEPYRYAPLYPFFIWGMAGLGWGITGVRAVQFLLGVIGVVLLWTLGKKVGGRTGAIVAGIGAAVYGPLVFFESELLSITLAVFFLEAALVLWGRPRWALLVGLLMGLAAMAQPNLLLAGVLGVVLAALFPAQLGWPGRKPVIFLAVGLLVFPALTLTRNLAVSGEPVLISTNGGINFYVGNNPVADGTFHLPPRSGLLNRPEGLFTSAREVAEQESGRRLTDVEVDRHWWLKGVDYWLTDPGRAMGVTVGKVLLSLNNAEVPSHYDYTYFTDRIPLLRVLPTMGWLLPLGGVGLILLLRRRQYVGPMWFLAVLLSIIPFFITGRYRLPLVILLLPAAGVLVKEVLARLARPRQIVWLGGAVAAYAVLAFFPLYSGGTTRAHMLNLEGTALVQQGKMGAARDAFEKAMEIDPSHPEVLNNLAYLHELEGDVATAMTYYKRAIQSNPIQSETYFNMESLYRKAGRHQEALEILNRFEQARGGRVDDVAGTLFYRQGVNTLNVGDTTRATELLEESVARAPDQAGPWITLSTVYRILGRAEDALNASEQAASLAPNSPEVLGSYGRALEEMGQFENSLTMYTRVLEMNPESKDLSFRVGRLLVLLERGEEAERHLLQANQGSPHDEALLLLAGFYAEQGRIEEAILGYEALTKIESAHTAEAKTRLRVLRGKTGR